MRIAVFGLGYVGTVTSACLALAGHRVMGIDVDRAKVTRLRRGLSPVAEQGLDAAIAEVVGNGNLVVRGDIGDAVGSADASFIVVGTPTDRKGQVDVRAVLSVADDIGQRLRKTDGYHLVVVRSTVPPGTTAEVARRVADASGRVVGEGFGICMNPEFLREGTALEDFRNPPYTVIGELDTRSGALLQSIYESIPGIEGQLYHVGLREAEMIKYANNCFHAMKICFANEIGRLCREAGVNGHRVMELVGADRKLNLSSYYLRPGFAYGGSCLPKDTRAILEFGRKLDVALPVVAAAISSNDAHLEYAATRIRALKGSRIAVIGLTFKEGTDDLRASPSLRLIEKLAESGVGIRAFDSHIRMGEELLGENRRILERAKKQLGEFLASSLAEVVEWADTLVLTSDGELQLSRCRTTLREEQAVIRLEPKAFDAAAFQGKTEDLV